MGSSIFTSKSAVCNAARTMRHFAWIAAIFGLLLAGCATSRVTNLTTSRQPRNPSGVSSISTWSLSPEFMKRSVAGFGVNAVNGGENTSSGAGDHSDHGPQHTAAAHAEAPLPRAHMTLIGIGDH